MTLFDIAYATFTDRGISPADAKAAAEALEADPMGCDRTPESEAAVDQVWVQLFGNSEIQKSEDLPDAQNQTSSIG